MSKQLRSVAYYEVEKKPYTSSADLRDIASRARAGGLNVKKLSGGDISVYGPTRFVEAFVRKESGGGEHYQWERENIRVIKAAGRSPRRRR